MRYNIQVLVLLANRNDGGISRKLHPVGALDFHLSFVLFFIIPQKHCPQSAYGASSFLADGGLARPINNRLPLRNDDRFLSFQSWRVIRRTPQNIQPQN